MLHINTLALSLLVPAAVSCGLIYYSWRYRAMPGAATFLLLNLGIAVWSIAYCLELMSTDLFVMYIWTRVEYLAIPIVPVLWFILVLRYTGRDHWLKPRYIFMLFIIPLITIALNHTNTEHYLFYSTVTLDTTGPFPMQSLTRGPWFWVHILYSYAVIIWGTTIMVQQLFRTNTKYRNQIIVILIGVSFPWLANIMYIFFGRPPLNNLDLTPFVFTISNVTMAWGMFRYQLFDITPVARDHVIEHMKDGMMVLDERNRLVDCNPSALRIFNWTEPPIGQSTSQIWKDWPEMLLICRSSQAEVIKGKYQPDEDVRFYQISVSQLHGNRKQITGRLMMIHDVTAFKQSETRLLTLSIQDSLTGLYNRLGFYRMAEQQMKVSDRVHEKLLLFFIDLDRLKAVNDALGHPAGDDALKAAADILTKTFRKSDIIARLGGDEFVVLAPCKNELDAVIAIDRLQQHIDEYNGQGLRSYQLSLSVGHALYDSDYPCSIDDLIRRADENMYEQKKANPLREFMGDSDFASPQQ